jgi:hypothetical protein
VRERERERVRERERERERENRHIKKEWKKNGQSEIKVSASLMRAPE